MLDNLIGLQKSISSIENQIFKNFEVWIINGGSSLATKAYLQTLDTPFYYLSEKDIGVYDAMNKGILMSKGDWIYFLGSGDVLLNNNVFDALFKSSIPKEYAIIAGKIYYEGKKNPFIYSQQKRTKTPTWSFSIWIRNGLHHQGTFYKKELFLPHKYNLNYPILSDYWFNILLYKQQVKCHLTSIAVAKCNSDGLSKTGYLQTYKEEAKLKINLSTAIFTPFFYSIAFIKYLTRKVIDG